MNLPPDVIFQMLEIVSPKSRCVLFYVHTVECHMEGKQGQCGRECTSLYRRRCALFTAIPSTWPCCLSLVSLMHCSIEEPAAAVVSALAGSHGASTLGRLAERDQLRCLLSARETHPLQAFQESTVQGAPPFPPSYKYVPSSDDYDGRRAPSWTDRILWRCNYLLEASISAAKGPVSTAPVTQTAYATEPSMQQSDHRPVLGSFTVALKHTAPLLMDEAVDAAAAYIGSTRGTRKWLGGSLLSKARPGAVVPIVSTPLRHNAAAL
jgi:hypothetical protein